MCVAGLVAMIRRSGGISAVSQRVSQYSNSPIVGQIIVLGAGIALFFDPNASIIFIGELVSPYFRLFPVSLEKYAFLIHATSVPVSAINPISTWVGFSAALIQSQVDKLVEMGYEELTIPDDGWSIFVRSIKYQFYPIFFLALLPVLIITRRDLGPMLIAERKRWLFMKSGQVSRWSLREKISRPEEDTPRRARNLWFPILFWSGAIWTAFSLVSDPDAADNATDFMAALIYCTIGTAAAVQIFYMLQSKKNGKIGFSPYDCMQNFCAERDNEDDEEEVRRVDSFLKRMKSGETASRASSRRPSRGANADFILKNLEASSEDGMSHHGGSVLHTLEPPTDLNDHIKLLQQKGTHDWEEIEATQQRDLRSTGTVATEEKSKIVVNDHPKALVSLKDGAECFFKGGATVTPVLMTLTLAWATTEVFLDLGMDRLFADLINRGNLKYQIYPTVAFTISFLLALTTGSSTVAQTIVLPLLAVPLYQGTDGNPELFYALVGSVMSGSVVGDHASPISTSCILSTFIIECDLKKHITTQTPYIVVVAFLSVLVGHLPSSYENYPYFFGYGIGGFLLGCFVYFLCEEALHEEGKYDFITERYLAHVISPHLQDLKTRMCIAHGMKMAGKDGDVLLDTDSISKEPSSDPEDESYVRQENELEMDEDYYGSYSVDESSASSSYYDRRPPQMGAVGFRSRSRRSIRGNPSNQTQRTENVAAGRTPASIMRSKSPEASRLSQNSQRNQRMPVSPNSASRRQGNMRDGPDRGLSPNSRGRATSPRGQAYRSFPSSPREVIEDTASAVTRDLIHPPGVEQIISSSDEGSFVEGVENDTAYGSTGDDASDAGGISHVTPLRTRVLRWLGQTIDGDDKDEKCANTLRSLETETHNGLGQATDGDDEDEKYAHTSGSLETETHNGTQVTEASYYK